jgi:hypothetical protein
MAITVERRLMSTRSFGVFHTSLRCMWHTGLKYKTDLAVASVSSLAFDQNSSKIIITFTERPNETHSFGDFPISPGSNLCTEPHLENGLSVARTPSWTEHALKGFVRNHLDETFFRYSLERFGTKPFVRNHLGMLMERFGTKPYVRNLFDFSL